MWQAVAPKCLGELGGRWPDPGHPCNNVMPPTKWGHSKPIRNARGSFSLEKGAISGEAVRGIYGDKAASHGYVAMRAMPKIELRSPMASGVNY